MLSTCSPGPDNVWHRYGDGVLETLAELRSRGVVVAHGIDATNLEASLRVSGALTAWSAVANAGRAQGEAAAGLRFDSIVFMFPLISSQLPDGEQTAGAAAKATAAPKAAATAAVVASHTDDDCARGLKRWRPMVSITPPLRNRWLLSRTVRGARPLLCKSHGRLLISAKADGKYEMRRVAADFARGGRLVPDSSASAGNLSSQPTLVFSHSEPFELSAHPGYTPRHVDTNETFPVVGASMYHFVWAESMPPQGQHQQDVCREAKRQRTTAKTGAVVAAVAESRAAPGNTAFSCALCNVRCGNAKALQQHTSSTRHQRSARLEKQWEALLEEPLDADQTIKS